MADYVIIGDWGTSSFTLSLCQLRRNQQTKVIETKRGQGVKFCRDFEGHFHNLCHDWYENLGNISARLSGMIGSTIGWKDAGYLPAPCDLNEFSSGGISFTSRKREITIKPGIKCINSLGLPDVMRGEEAQIFGYLRSLGSLSGSQLICLPGTHTKWALIDNGRIIEFLTIPSGELHHLTSQYGIFLDGEKSSADNFDTDKFLQTVKQIATEGNLDFMTTLFSTRSLRVLGELTSIQAEAYLSAVIIGSDVKSALKVYFDQLNSSVEIPIIGAELNADLYSKTLNLFGLKTRVFSGSDTNIAGLISGSTSKEI